MSNSVIDRFKPEFTNAFRLPLSPLVQCLTNEITVETVANALLAVGAKPVMADDPRELADFLAQSDAVLLNLGHLSASREASLRLASQIAHTNSMPAVLDLVGVSASPIRQQLGEKILADAPMVVKGNLSEMRFFAGLATKARGVDQDGADAKETALLELATAFKQLAQTHPQTIFLATGPVDLVVSAAASWQLHNGVPQLDRFTGTGDVVGALIAALLGTGMSAMAATVVAVSYLNRCGELAVTKHVGLASFRLATLDQLSLLAQASTWFIDVKGWQL